MKRGSENNNWRGGKSISSHGYVLVRVGKEHHLADVRGYAYEHRLVAEAKLGRRLKKGEIPHHINGNKQDNRPENIEIMASVAHHMNQHRRNSSKRRLAGQKNPMAQCACGCGEWFLKYDDSGRPRSVVSGHNMPNRSKQEAFIAACGDGSCLAEISAKTGQSLQAVKVMASKLVQEGKLTRKGRGIYGKND